MSELLPTRQAQDVREGLLDYLTTTFALADDDARLALADFLTDEDRGLFKGPYLRLRLPFRPANLAPTIPADGEGRASASGFSWLPDFVPYGHQAAAFERLSSADLGPDHRRPLPTLITTGTGSGKTEAFLYPILDHVLRARRAGVTGTKALILYPMNALANDQASRLARLLTSHEELAGITAALYTGQKGPTRTTVTPEGLITDRGIIRDTAPDLLLTNYKMLDQLLLRHEDARLWSQSATSLQYLVLDEFHTYDGAQGTDVAMLLRRLRLTLQSYTAEPIAVTPVATSATLGDQGDPAAMIEFATTVFGVDLDPGCVVGEERLSLADWVSDAPGAIAAAGLTPRRLALSDLGAINEAVDAVAAGSDGAHASTLVMLAALYDVGVETLLDAVGDSPQSLLLLTQAHPMVQSLASASEQATHLTTLAELLLPGPAAAGAEESERVTFLTHLVAALSHVRALAGRSALTVETHLWVRELTRIDRVASSTADYRWSDDGALGVRDADDPFAGQARPVFPAIYCRHCGRSGWGVELAPVGADLAVDDGAIRRHHATGEGRFRALLSAPLEAQHAGGEPPASIDGLRWFSVRQRRLLAAAPLADDRDAREGWILPVLTHVGGEADQDSRADTCPSCQKKDAIRFLGSAVATLLSVTLSTLFGSADLDAREKKALVFTDSVQDAAHRAGFVESRSHVLTLRSVLRSAVGDAPKTLDALVTEAIAQAGDDQFRRFRLVPPSLVERAEFSPFWRKDAAREVPTTVLTRVRRRLLFDAVMEFGLLSRVGRTLEQTGSVVVEVEAGQPAKLAAIGRGVLNRIEVQEAIDSPLNTLSDARIVAWVRGTLEHLREGGAIDHEWFAKFIKEDGNRYRIWGGRPRSQGMPAFTKDRSAPAFPRVGPTLKIKDPLLDPVTSPQSWYARWTARTLGVQPGFGAKLARLLLDGLAHADVLKATTTDSSATVYAIPASSVIVHPTTDADLAAGKNLLVCTVCRSQLPGTPETIAQLTDAPCLLVRCPGKLAPRADASNYYRSLYASADMRRIVSREHSSLLDDKTRLTYEQGFKQGQTRPDAPNVLVATPTLEMGIDIGDLSAVLLASLPKTVTSYLQRVGRAGRLTGNALNLAFVTGRGTNLQRLGDPLSIINGPVRPPATYLGAAEILRRQYVAHLVDAFARDPARPHPHLTSFAMKSTPGSFLGQLIDFAESDADAHLARFLGCFAGLSDAAEEGLRTWATASEGPGSSPLARQVYEASQRWNATVESLTHRRKAIEASLPELEHVAALPAASDDDKRAARSARAALKVTAKELGDLRGDYWIGVLEEFGLLPNYTLVDDSVTLEVAWTWVDPDTSEWQYDSTSLQRASANALREFAPGSTFYARGMEIAIDTVDLGLEGSAITSMAFCPSCGYASEGVAKACARCGDPGIGGVEHRLDVIELTRVSSELNRDEAQINDRTDERRQERFSIFLAADIDPAAVVKEWYVDAYAFGVKYLARVDLRWINAGRTHGMPRQLAGVRQAAPLFRLCEGCGKLDRHSRSNSRGEHRPWCRYRTSDAEHTRDLALSRTLRTQGAVLRLPLSVTLGDRFALPSLAASVAFGLQEQIGGLPDHIAVAPISMPVPAEGGATVVEALLLHDLVPGGTGYLAELANPARVWDLLHRAWRAVASCACRDEGLLACHRCLLPFAASGQVDRVSRAAAERHLRELLTAGASEADDPVSEMGWTVTELEPTAQDAESHLEQRFRKLFSERLADLGATLKETPGAWGNALTITFPNATRQWTLEPQVPMGGVKPDFVLRSSQHTLPVVAIFTDGWRFHAVPARNRIADDAQKRAVLRDQGHIVVAVTWRDLERALAHTPSAPAWLDPQVVPMLMQQSGKFGPDHVELVHLGPIDFLLGWIQNPDPDGYRALGNQAPWLFAKGATELALDPAEDLDAAALEQFTQASPTPVRAITNAWWWRFDDLGVLTRGTAATGDAMLLETVVIVDDRPERLDEGHRPSWEEWLRISNLLGLRFQPTHILALSQLLAGTVAPLETPAEVGALPPRWTALLEHATDAERALFAALAQRESVPLPEVGYETNTGVPLDVAWPKLRIAVDLGVHADTRQELEQDGWTWVLPEVDAVIEALTTTPQEP